MCSRSMVFASASNTSAGRSVLIRDVCIDEPWRRLLRLVRRAPQALGVVSHEGPSRIYKSCLASVSAQCDNTDNGKLVCLLASVFVSFLTAGAAGHTVIFCDQL